MEKTIEIPEGYEARIEGNKVILEQKESEDERIRRELVQYIKDYPNIPNGQYSRSDFFAYLERQKESELLNNDEYHTVKVEILDRLYAHEKELEQLKKEQKPAVEQLHGTFTSYDMAKTFTEGQHYVMEHPEKFGLCKPVEWSEEDKQKLNGIINCLCSTSGDIDGFDEWYDWLEDLPNRFALESKQEWSEGTKKALDKISDYLKYKGRAEDADFIRRLRPQPHWKPSEEQMKALLSELPVVKGSGDKV